MLVLSHETLADLRATARAAAPAECCGLLVGHEAQGRITVSALHPVPNDVADRYHIPPGAFLEVERAARAAGTWVYTTPIRPMQPCRAGSTATWPGRASST